MATTPLVSFGLITDVQYADVDDGWNYARTQERFYRSALDRLRGAIDEWVSQATRDGREDGVEKTRKPIKFAVNLGDLLDGKNRPAGTTRAALEAARAACRSFEQRVGGPVHHIVGNHELYNFTQAEFDRELKWPHAENAYYDFTLPEHAPNARFIVLNAYGVTSLGRSQGDPVFEDARRRLRQVNRNEDLNSPVGLKRDRKRFVEYNGAVDDAQLAWLQSTLARASAAREDVVIFTHIPIHPKSCPWNCLLWNYEQVLAVVLEHASCVRAVFAGHVHGEGYAKDRGVHFLVCDAVLECDPMAGETAHAVVDVLADRLVVNGYGKVPTRELRFPTRS